MSVASKNLFDLLDNDSEDPAQAAAPKKDIAKPNTASKKRETQAPSAPKSGGDSRGSYNQRRGGGGRDNDATYRDRQTGGTSNRRDFGDAPRERIDRGDRGNRGGDRDDRGGGRRGRGGSGRGRGREFDRHSGMGRTDTEKQVSQGWGAVEGKSEWNDEQAGQNIANKEASEEFVPANITGEADNVEGVEEAAAEPEPEDHTKSFADYKAELESRNPVAELPQAREANEGSRENKKWAAAKELKKEEDDEYMSGGKFKSKASKARKEKTFLDIDQRYVEPRRGGDRGGRGGGRGGGGERRGGAPRGGGEYRGGERRGGRGGLNRDGNLNIADSHAFPSLGK